MSSNIEDILEADHGELDSLLARVFAAIEAGDRDETYRSLDFFWARLAMHIRAEHLRLFPAARRIAENGREDSGDVPRLLEDLQHDHDFFMRNLARAIKAMRLVFDFGNETETFEIVRDLLGEIKERLVVHNRIEEERIYPLANEALLEPTELETLSRSVKKELDNYPQRFAAGRPGS